MFSLLTSSQSIPCACPDTGGQDACTPSMCWGPATDVWLYNMWGVLQDHESFMYLATEHFRMSGVYWGLTALQLLGKLDLLNEDTILEWVLRCQKEDGGFGGSERHDSHMLYTLSAVQILALYDRLDLIDTDRVVQCARTTTITRSSAMTHCCTTCDVKLMRLLGHTAATALTHGLRNHIGLALYAVAFGLF